MFNTLKVLKQEHTVNIKELQKSPSRSLKGITRVLRGSDTLGYFLDAHLFEDFIEDLEAVTSATYQKRIKRARTQRGGLSIAQVKRRYGI